MVVREIYYVCIHNYNLQIVESIFILQAPGPRQHHQSLKDLQGLLTHIVLKNKIIKSPLCVVFLWLERF